MKQAILFCMVASIFSAMILSLPISSGSAMSLNASSISDQNLDTSKVTTSWNLSFLFKNKDDARAAYRNLNLSSEQINKTFRPKFDNVTGKVILDYIQEDENFSKSLSLLHAYASTQNSLNVNDKFYEDLLSDVQNLSAEHAKITSFADIKLKSLPKSEWEKFFAQELGLTKYRPYVEASYIRYFYHRPRNESHAAYLADLSNQLMKLDTKAGKIITNNVTRAGNITLSNGTEREINSQSYYEILSTDIDRGNRNKCYDKRYYHLFNESEEMGPVYVSKSKLDDRYARELNFSDAYDARMFDHYLNASQIDEMNSVFKERKGDFDGYYEFRKEKLGLSNLMPYDLFLQLMRNPDKRYNYTESLKDINASFSDMDPAFSRILIDTATSNSVDVYPDPDHGKQSIQYAQDLCALKRPALVFLNYKGLIGDEFTVAHEMGHVINFYLMGQSVEYLYCGGTMYEMEIPSTFDEELFVDYALKNYDEETAEAVLANQISNYDNTFTFQTMITEFERKAHELISQKAEVNASELNALWSDLDKEYRSNKVDYYPEGEPKWTYVSHIYFKDNYYTFNYALSRAITLSLFKRYLEDPQEFDKNYTAYLSAGTTMTPTEKLKKYFGLEINRKLFEDAMDIVKLRVDQLQQLSKRENIKNL